MLLQTIRRLIFFAVAFVLAGTYLISRPDPVKPNLALVLGCGAYICAAVLIALVSSWAIRVSRYKGNPRVIEVTLPRAVTPETEWATLEVRRPAEHAEDFVRKYEIRVDRTIAAALRVGEVMRARIPAGPHLVTVSIGENQSEVLSLDLGPDESVRYLIRPEVGSFAERRFAHWLMLTKEL